MSRDLFKLLAVVGAILFAVLFGMELANRGIHSVYGPIDSSGAAVNGREDGGTVGTNRDRAGEQSGAVDPESVRYGNEPQGISYDGEDEGEDGSLKKPTIPRADHAPMVDRLAGKTADALQSASRGGIQFIVNLFG